MLMMSSLGGCCCWFVVVVVEWLGSLWFRSLFRFRYGGFVVVEECNVRLRFLEYLRVIGCFFRVSSR